MYELRELFGYTTRLGGHMGSLLIIRESCYHSLTERLCGTFGTSCICRYDASSGKRLQREQDKLSSEL